MIPEHFRWIQNFVLQYLNHERTWNKIKCRISTCHNCIMLLITPLISSNFSSSRGMTFPLLLSLTDIYRAKCFLMSSGPFCQPCHGEKKLHFDDNVHFVIDHMMLNWVFIVLAQNTIIDGYTQTHYPDSKTIIC